MINQWENASNIGGSKKKEISSAVLTLSRGVGKPGAGTHWKHMGLWRRNLFMKNSKFFISTFCCDGSFFLHLYLCLKFFNPFASPAVCLWLTSHTVRLWKVSWKKREREGGKNTAGAYFIYYFTRQLVCSRLLSRGETKKPERVALIF